jgi:hypothetical protein
MHRLSVAHVGHVDAPDDHQRWLTVCQWLGDHDPPFLRSLRAQEERGELDSHYIDLNRDPPRDFLVEQHAHDLVVIHNLWGEFCEGYDLRTGGAAQSALHTADNWRRRLRETGAKYVFLAGGNFNYADFDGNVPGFEKVGFIGRWYVSILRSTSA